MARYLLALLLFAFNANAQNAKVDTGKILDDAKGVQLKDGIGCEPHAPIGTFAWNGFAAAGCPELTLRRAAMHALTWPHRADKTGDKHADLGMQAERAALAQRIMSDADAGLTDAEIALVKRLISRHYGGALDVQVDTLLDPAKNPLCPVNQSGVRQCR